MPNSMAPPCEASIDQTLFRFPIPKLVPALSDYNEKSVVLHKPELLSAMSRVGRYQEFVQKWG